jgi:hypothetical protein
MNKMDFVDNKPIKWEGLLSQPDSAHLRDVVLSPAAKNMLTDHADDAESALLQNVADPMESEFPIININDEDQLSDTSAITSVITGSGETMLATEMAKLSVSEREEVMHDIHGVTEDEVKETPALVAEKLSELDDKVKRIRTVNFPNQAVLAYSLAEALSPEYVQDSSLRLMFLRASNFNVDQAAQTLLGHFEKKLELFGPNKLASNITLDDLDADDMACLSSGQSQILPYRDRSGRAVFFQALSHYRYRNVKNAVS